MQKKAEITQLQENKKKKGTTEQLEMFRGEKNGMIDVLKGKHIMKGKCYVFSDYKEGKMFFNYSECKHQKHTYA